jgi:hypothetical protein
MFTVCVSVETACHQTKRLQSNTLLEINEVHMPEVIPTSKLVQSVVCVSAETHQSSSFIMRDKSGDNLAPWIFFTQRIPMYDEEIHNWVQ